ncbi:MAG TPA: hypothetical protein RMH99_28680 [Sandaracinaceae bacterium LLY-WYZ-13_1]|nr:hypothetical protein [Sandaracinaceae bacterium LLY-WYZ-13_1]
MRAILASVPAAVTFAVGCAGEPAPLPSLYDDPALAAQVAEADGIDGVAPRLGGFVHGAPVRYWTVGGATEVAMPVYRLCRAEGDETCAPIDHPPVVDRIPGEDGYSAFGQVHWVQLPEGWDGRLASVDAIEAEIGERGLAPPVATSELWHCPIAGADARLDVGLEEPMGPDETVYVRGMEARCFDFTATRDHRAVLPDGTMFVRNVYVLQREGEDAPLVEAARMEDLTGDGDTTDSNNVFGVGLEDFDYTPLWRLVVVTVPDDYASIDTAGDEATADYTDSAQMFDVAPDYTITPIEGAIVDYELTDTLINCPLQSADGAL